MFIFDYILVDYNRKQALSNISAYSNRLTLSLDQSSNLNVFEKQYNPEIYYEVTLNNVPVGEKLSLKCNWIDPNGQIAHQNNYQTRKIDKQVWPTHCRYSLNNGTVTGNWQVEMLLGDRLLSSSNFTVK